MKFKNIICVLIMLVVFGGVLMECYSAQGGELVLSVSKKKLEYNIGEPIWVTVSLANKTEADIIVWINGDRDKGAFFKPNLSGNDKIKLLPQKVQLETIFKKIVIKAKEKITFDCLLNDFVGFIKKGDYNINCNLQLKNVDGKRINLKDLFKIKIGNKLNVSQIENIIKDLKIKLKSKSIDDRLRAVRSMKSIDSVKTITLLKEAIADEDESVQLATIEILSSLNSSEASMVIENALTSDNNSVKRAAKLELNKRHKMKQ